mmetsp:Transcript_40168/g.96920  ORF Transcript_40168/g.96920 Transcript_40168/m.96920 type:complete len:438 (+) Transcript_40168:42-1355(+)
MMRFQEPPSSFVEDIPESNPEPDGIDNLLNAELCNLSLDERGQVFDDIHGVSDVIEETPELVSDSLERVDEELKLINDKYAYDFAYALDPKYVKNRVFRLRFLRATLFDAKATASRIVQHFEIKMELFGKDKLSQDITQDDLDPEDLTMLYAGYYQNIGVRDRAGRGVDLWLTGLKPNLGLDPATETKHRLRRLFYAQMVISRDEEIQKKGQVVVVWAVELPRSANKNRSAVWATVKMLSCLPIRLNAVHICFDNLFYKPLITLGSYAADTFTRVRMRSHFGSCSECIHELKTFGIPVYALPFDENGNASTENHKAFWATRRQLERKCSGLGKVLSPGPFDVLLGRGRLCQEHVGNVRYRKLVVKHKQQYDSASTVDKTAISFMIINLVKDASGRFLKDNGDGWVEVDDKRARDKVSHSFRTLRYTNHTTSTHTSKP